MARKQTAAATAAETEASVGSKVGKKKKVITDVSRFALSLLLSFVFSLSLSLSRLFLSSVITQASGASMYRTYGILWHLWDFKGLATRMIAYDLLTSVTYGILWHLWDFMGLATWMIAYYLLTSVSLSVAEENISCR